jgi:hypothetical protein
MKRIIYTIIAIAALIAGGSIAQSCAKDAPVITGTIDGLISDSESGEPVRAAEVMITPGGKTTVTGADGYYQYADLDVGEYTVQVRKNGYITATRRITVQQAQTARCDVVMHAGTPSLTVNKTAVAFGKTGASSAVFQISNTGQTALSWSITASCVWLAVVTPSQGLLDAGEKTSITVTIDREKVPNDNREHFYDIIIESSSGSAVVTLSVGGDQTGGGDGTTVVAGGLAACYTFDDGTVADITGNGYDGAAINAPEFITATPNGAGKAVFLKEMNSEKLALPNPVKNAEAYTVSLWLKDVGTGNILQGTGSPMQNYNLGLSLSNGQIIINNNKTFDGAGILQNGDWHHLVSTGQYAGDQLTMALYIDGAFYGSESSGFFPMVTSSTAIYIGGTGFSTPAVNLKTDNIRFYGRVLSAAEITQIYNAKQ